MILTDEKNTPLQPEASAGTPPQTPSAMERRWIFPEPPSAQVHELAARLAFPAPLTAVLWDRGLRTVRQARAYLSPSSADLHDPLLLCGMQEAVVRILHAIRQREPVLIYGDYDVDGTLATVLLKTAIDRLTPKAVPSLVRYHIPHRIREGYGVQGGVLADAAETGIRLVISVDTGIRAFAAADEAKRLGLDLIVTDHHLPEDHGVPEAVAVINPNQRACTYPFKELCGAAVACKLAEALLRAGAQQPSDDLQPVTEEGLAKLLPSLLKLVAIATVADAVALNGENRAIVSMGLRELSDVRQPGLRALMHLAEVGGNGAAPTATEIGFRIGPRINAAGRMDVASDVVRLLLTRDPAEGEQIARKLHALNEDRRSVERGVLQAIETEFLERLPAVAEERGPDCLVIDGEGWHRGVIGILASRVVERTNLPALVVSREGTQAHGSGRSVPGFHLLDAITAAHFRHEEETGTGLFDRFGGHAHAVGFSLSSAHVEALQGYLSEYAKQTLAPSALERTLEIAAELELDAISPSTMRHLRRMEPFGNGNAEPVFAARAVRLVEVKPLKERHVRLRLQQGEAAVSCLAWARSFSWPERLAELGITTGASVDVAFQVRENRHPDFGGPELQLCDIRLAGVSR